MALLLHITIALLSILVTTYIFLSPSKAALRGSYVLIILTLASGTYLVASTQTHIVQSCLMGLIYLSISVVGLASAHRRLALEVSTTRTRRK
jgi:hypothetical protein